MGYTLIDEAKLRTLRASDARSESLAVIVMRVAADDPAWRDEYGWFCHYCRCREHEHWHNGVEECGRITRHFRECVWLWAREVMGIPFVPDQQKEGSDD